MRPLALWFGTLLCLVASCGGGPSDVEDVRVEAEPNLAQASRNYILKCSVCHGTDGAPVLAGAPDLRTSTMTVEERVAIIAYGKGTMPPHRGMLDMPTIRGIAVYIEKFRE